ncbi:Cullin-4 [Schizosaccharomyces pombe]|uniref:Cullin-4 n=1 Tax=Schizosaccharomyces pombe (strain 972 / ATCC 24843) TaxID=284812 RepID=CUL4_SCHPO|nr:cullin 4 [Schizosaccharomyces pombe]O14122.1 RecName: Full=Cullin-4; Short=Cul-4 [Schizosaccharomyces pombe 972h-]BAA32520.1 Pcu4 [Schizosaccharomyces pombe]CAB16383.1 cullin 4 [Schizosaccharomyces pombe]|eukprot:NP_594195.1 cullin 4 [Schizosaccharomyces pombe]
MPPEAKRIVVKGFDPRKSRQRQETYYVTMIDRLNMALQVVMAGLGLKTGYQELYSGVENLTRADQASRCFNILQHHMSSGIQLLKDSAESFIQLEGTETDTNACTVVVGCWNKWLERVEIVQNIFYYMDKTFLSHHPDYPTIEELSLSLFREKLMAVKNIQIPFLNSLLQSFENLHSSKSTDHAYLQDAMLMLHRTEMYSSVFVPMYLVMLSRFYDTESSQKIQELPLEEYLEYAMSSLEREDAYVEKFDIVRDKKSIRETVQRCLITSHLDTLTKGISQFIEKRDAHSCKLLYALLQFNHETEYLIQPWSDCLVDVGFKLVNDESKDDTLVQELLSFHKFLQVVVDESFLHDETLSYAMRKAFETFINGAKGSQREAPARLIAKYIDYLLRVGEQASGGKPLKEVFSEILDLFRYIASKDIFEAYYKLDIAKRLLLNKSASAQNELMLLDMLKKTCGSQFTHSLEGMFRDVNISKEFTSSFRHSKAAHNLHRDLYVNVLSQAYWPSYPESHIRLPDDMQQDLDCFEKFYLSKQVGKKISWYASLGHCIVKARFPLGNKELSISLFQACVLLQFNNCLGGEGISYQDLKKSTELSDIDLTRTLQSLSCARIRPLVMVPKSKKPSPDTMFYVNEKFTDKLYRVKINQIYLKEERQENSDVQEQVVRDRQFELQASIVRVMKQKEKMKHDDLVQYVINNVKDRGIPLVSDVKTAIEKLLEKEYLEREDNDIYTYVT